ncbi:MAG TPA: hypothetical protein PKZ36_02075 [Candidatus Paceibacterota bacterium]|nr:hypothetical protein [Candidatus Paceibacterota bacterium]HPT18175.1 hypothetical protein [Candidatus Paceibacterota bacterium]
MADIPVDIAVFLFNIVLWILPLIGTIFLAVVAWKLWIHYVQQNFISGIDFVLLEIVPPRDVLRSPKAMELFFTNALYHKSTKGGIEEFWQGAVWFWFSLEIVSIDGQVHFYIRTPTRIRGLIETQMYAQYPQAQIKEVDDYTLAVDEISDNSKYNLWGCEFWLDKPEAYPIKTYVDFGLDKDPKEEFKVDPIAPIIELFGSLKKGEQMWLQFVITPARKKYHTIGTWFKNHDWVAESRLEVRKILKPYMAVKDEGKRIEVRVPSYLEGQVEGINSKITKLGFDCGIRACYVAKKESYDLSNRRNLRLIFRQYATPSLNCLERHNSTQADAFTANFFESFFLISQKTITRLSNRMLEEYRERAFFYTPLRHKLSSFIPWPLSPYIFPKYFHHNTFVLNTEEIATLWHFPGQILKVPTLERIESKEASPPPNLPI